MAAPGYKVRRWRVQDAIDTAHTAQKHGDDARAMRLLEAARVLAEADHMDDLLKEIDHFTFKINLL